MARHGVRALRRCLSVCPTGAIYEKFLDDAPAGHEESLRQVKSTCTFCGVGCQLDLNVDTATNRIKVTSQPHYVSNQGDLCVKGRFSFNFVHHPDRLTEPLVRGEDGELHEATWDEALDAVAAGPEGDRAPRPAGSRITVLRPPDQRGELPDPEACAHGRRHQFVHSCEAT